MEIPAFFATKRGKGLSATDGRFYKGRAQAGERAMPLKDAVSQGSHRESRSPVVIIDCDSLSRDRFIVDVMKGMKAPGADIWFMTYAEDTDDIFDAFNTNAEKILLPSHLVRSDEIWRDIHRVSDEVYPTIFVCNGSTVTGNRLLDRMSHLVDLGFYRICVVDQDGSIGQDTWDVILEDFPSTVPFMDTKRAVTLELGFEDRISRFPMRSSRNS